MKLIKLAYIAHGWMLALTDMPLLSEPVEAWRYGPVVPSLYHYFKRFGNQPIPPSEQTALPNLSAPDQGDDSVRAALDAVWQAYKGQDGLQLSAKTHKSGTPWYKTWLTGGEETGCSIIPDDLIRQYYKNLMGDVMGNSGAGA